MFLASVCLVPADTPTNNLLDPTILKKLSLEELSQIEVTTRSKSPEKAFDSPAAVFVITGEDIRHSGATSIPEALRMAPGVEVARVDSNHWSVGIRGFGTRLNRSVLVLMDGRTVYTTLFDGTYWEVQDTLLEDVDRIEVIRGPGGTVWGPNAVNGVINIITKPAKDTRGGFVSIGGGNLDQGFINARYGGGNDKGFDYRVYERAFTRGPEKHSDGRNFDDWRATQAGFRMDWTGSAAGSFTLQGDIYTEDAGERSSVDGYSGPSRSVDSNAELAGGNLLARWQKAIRPGNDIQVQVYYDRTKRLEANLSDVRNTFDVDFLQRLRISGRQTITWGVGGRVVPINNDTITSGLAFVPANRTDYLVTGFLQDDISLVQDRLIFTVGTKILQTNFLHGVGWEPSARLAWMPDDNQTLWAAFTHAVRTPSDVEENFYLASYHVLPNGTPFVARFNANSRFSPEEMNGYELGYRRLLGKQLLFSVSSFYNHYHDLLDQELIGFSFETSQPPGVAEPIAPHNLLSAKFGNGLLATTKGIEVTPEWRPTSSWRLRGAYSFLHMNVYKAPGSLDVGSAPGIQGASPDHQVAIESEYDVTKKIQIDLGYRYVGALPAQGVDAYSTGDARVGWRIAPQVELSFVARDLLLQPAHFESAGDGIPVGIKRSAYAQMTWRR